MARKDGCIEWRGRLHPAGYGTFSVRGRNVLAHRAAYAAAHGPIAAGMVVCHSCDNPPCVNPEHLFLGTQADNLADMTAKGRANRRGPAKLTIDSVAQIRTLIAQGWQQSDIGPAFGVTDGAVYHIKHGLTWRPEVSCG